MRSTIAKILLAIYIILFTALSFNPYDRKVWAAENLPIVLIVIALIIIYKYYVFSPTAYILMMFLIVFHTIGGYYTFARVPFDFITHLFGFERNHYDRMSHFTVGFYAFAIAELLMEKRLTNSKVVLGLFAIMSIMTIAAVYEIFEWQFALMADKDAGLAVLGCQGDVWDAQKDMFADGLGAIFATILFFIINWKNPLLKEMSQKPKTEQSAI